MLVSSLCRISWVHGHIFFKHACRFNSVLMGKWLHWYILKCNTDSFHGFCRICLKLNFLYSIINMQNDTFNFFPPPPLNHQLPKPNSSHQYSTNTYFLVIIYMSTAISSCQHCLISSTWGGKKFCYCLHNRENMTLNLKPGAYRMYDGRTNESSMRWHTFMPHQRKIPSDMNTGIHIVSDYNNCMSCQKCDCSPCFMPIVMMH